MNTCKSLVKEDDIFRWRNKNVIRIDVPGVEGSLLVLTYNIISYLIQVLYFSVDTIFQSYQHSLDRELLLNRKLLSLVVKLKFSIRKFCGRYSYLFNRYVFRGMDVPVISSRFLGNHRIIQSNTTDATCGARTAYLSVF